MLSHKLFRCDWLRFVTGPDQGAKGSVRGNDVFGLRSDSAIHKLVVLRVSCDNVEAKLGFKQENVGMQVKEESQQCLYLVPPNRTQKPSEGFLVLHRDLI